MDHLPRPVSPAVPPLEIPFVADIIYDFIDFTDFPRRHGFIKDDGDQLDLSLPLEKIAAFLQSWLWFGVVAEFSGHPVDFNEFTRRRTVNNKSKSTSFNVLDSTALEPTLQELQSRQNSATLRIPAEDLRRLASILDEAIAWSQWLDLYLNEAQSPIPEILLSIKILLISFSPFVKDYIPNFRPAFQLPMAHPSSIKNQMPPPAQLLVEWMSGNGWCPFRAYQLCLKFSYLVIFYIAQIQHRDPYSLSHDACSMSSCVAREFSRDTSIQHTKSGCQCSFVSVPTEEIANIIQQDGIPLISVETLPHGNIKLHVEKATDKSNYVAISHVYSHGFGNLSANSLPQCQMERLFKDMRSLPDPIPNKYWLTRAGIGPLSFDLIRLSYNIRRGPNNPLPLFWIDTLCLPAGAEYDELRTQGSDRIGQTFAGASHTLVSDLGLRQLRLSASDKCEVLARVICSEWINSCWTFQEGTMSQSCNIQCADGAFALHEKTLDSEYITPHQLYRTPENSLGVIHKGFQAMKDKLLRVSPSSTPQLYKDLLRRAISQNLVSDLGIITRDTWRVGWPDESPWKTHCEQLQSAWNMLAMQAASDGDVSIVLANLLGFNIPEMKMLRIPRHRMEGILLSLDDLPVSILYNHGPKEAHNTNHKNRWLPSAPGPSFIYAYPTMKRVSEGFFLSSAQVELQSRALAVYLLDLEISRMGRFILRDPEIEFEATIEICHPSNDEFILEPNCSTFIIIDIHDAFDWQLKNLEPKGACLKASNVSTVQPKSTVKAVYNCPIRIWPRPFKKSTTVAGEPALLVQAFRLKDWELLLEYDKSGLDRNKIQAPYPRRPHLYLSWTQYYFLQYPFGLLSGILSFLATVIFVVIIEQSYHESSSLGKVAMITLLTRFIPHHRVRLSLLLIWWLLPLPLFIIARRLEGHFTPLDKAFLGLEFGALLVIFVANCIGYVAWGAYVYRGWLATFGSLHCSSKGAIWMRRMSWIAEFEKRASNTRFIRDIFGAGNFAALTGVTWIDALYNLFYEKVWWDWLKFKDWSKTPPHEFMRGLRRKLRGDS
ncbi:hypothetical protein AOQ84DRAFT_437454 [Glonium stellatum]|uniref:Heterokaryon incompatibility domain-containing protein n=1 Tax=Glonium stellatum TaxID=574774 RepID=A0A8E2JW82_9PEZI|nr:hypothetical protein AOQ84DRAFT_437454 [Glonium stellatum]